jgi:NAD(P)-dependent dehydrogenase (short-subunit alcohol dehydrogenase family)
MYAPDLLHGQCILVTGGGTGLGRAMAQRFAALGARTGLLARRAEPLEEACAAIAAAGGRAAHATADVRDAGQVEAAVDAIEAALGPVTALVNNAAGNFLAPTEDLSPNAFDAVVRIVLHGAFHCTRAAGRRWIERGSGGSVLNILTTYAWMGSPFVVPSACAKAGVLAMTRSLAVEWATYRIRVNAIAPGPFPTEGAFSRLMTGPWAEHALARVPAGRFGEPAELADLAVYLLSPGAAYVTGECVTIDGGDWLKGGQEFAGLTDLPRADAKTAMAALRPPK